MLTSFRTPGCLQRVGDKQIVLSEPVDWRAGDRIALASSRFNPREVDLVTIAAVLPDGRTINLTSPLQYRHYGERYSVGDWTADLRAEVGHLTRNIVIRGDSVSEAKVFGCHVVVDEYKEQGYLRRGVFQANGVAFENCGQVRLSLTKRAPLKTRCSPLGGVV